MIKKPTVSILLYKPIWLNLNEVVMILGRICELLKNANIRYNSYCRQYEPIAID
jgi:hypothetical protein